MTEKVIIFYSNLAFRDVTRQKKKTRFFVTLRRQNGRRADTDLVRFSRNIMYSSTRYYRIYTIQTKTNIIYYYVAVFMVYTAQPIYSQNASWYCARRFNANVQRI